MGVRVAVAGTNHLISQDACQLAHRLLSQDAVGHRGLSRKMQIPMQVLLAALALKNRNSDSVVPKRFILVV